MPDQIRGKSESERCEDDEYNERGGLFAAQDARPRRGKSGSYGDDAGMTTRTEGTTAEGVRIVVIHADHYADDQVFVNGEELAVRNVSRLRDGGTTRYTTDRGTLVLPRRINDPDRTPRWVPS